MIVHLFHSTNTTTTKAANHDQHGTQMNVTITQILTVPDTVNNSIANFKRHFKMKRSASNNGVYVSTILQYLMSSHIYNYIDI